MYSQSFSFSGYAPGLPSEMVGKSQNQMAVVDGENFAWTVDGVFSAYGNTDIGKPAGAVVMAHPHTAVINNVLHAFYQNGVWKLVAGVWELAFDFTSAPAFTNHKGWDLDAYKWTDAYIGTAFWFCHPSIGLMFYDQFTDQWGWLRDDCWTGPIYACANADNRLVLLLEDTVVWSHFDRGDKFTCDTWHAGSGAQSLALIQYGQPYSVLPYRGGWLTFTSMGVMRSQPNADVVGAPDGKSVAVGALVFNHAPVTQVDISIGATGAAHINGDVVIWLAPRGFMQFAPSQGGGWGAMQEFEPVMGKFYAEYLLPASTGRVTDRFCLDVARDAGWLFVSSRGSDDLAGYSRAHVYQPDMQKWGSFNLAHLHVGRGTAAAQMADLNFINTAGKVRLVQHKIGAARKSWIKFSPMRLQAPNEPSVPAGAMSTVQGARVGVGSPVWEGASPSLSLASQWADAKRKPELSMPGTLARFFCAGGFDDYEPNVDQQIWMVEVSRHDNMIYLAGSTSGVTHTFGALAETSDEFFHITSLELDFTFTGVK